MIVRSNNCSPFRATWFTFKRHKDSLVFDIFQIAKHTVFIVVNKIRIVVMVIICQTSSASDATATHRLSTRISYLRTIKLVH